MTQAQQHNDGELLPVQALFSYDVLDAETKEWARQEAVQIRQLRDNVAQDMVRIGQRLVAVRNRLPQGLWTRWLENEFHWSKNHAYEMIRIAELFGNMTLDGVASSKSALQLVTTSSLPPDVQTKVKDHIATHKGITMQEAREIVQPYDPDLAREYGNSQIKNEARLDRQARSIAHEITTRTRNLQVALVTTYGDRLRSPVAAALQSLYDFATSIEDSDFRVAITPKEKAFLKRRPQWTASRYKGVVRRSDSGKWLTRAQELVNGKLEVFFSRSYETEEEAARVYDAVAFARWGDKAHLNFPGEPLVSIPPPHVGVSGYIGVRPSANGLRWRAAIGINGRTTSIGTYDSPEEAARAYDAKAREAHGDQARLNFPKETS